MESGSVHSGPGTVEKLFQDFKGRRAGIIKALTIEVDEFYDRCDPEKGNLCLFGYPDGSWDVNRPADEVPPELPEPLLGINFAREEMQKYEWLSLVAAHSDAWLMAVSSYIGARSGFRKNERKRLFGMINELPTIYEVTVSNIEKQTKDNKFVVPNNNGNNHRGCKNKSSGQQLAEIQSQLHLLTNQHKQTLQELVKVKAELAELKTQLKQRDDELAQVPIAQSAKEIPAYVQMKSLMKSIKSEMMGKDEEIRRLSQLLQSSQEKGRGMPSRPS